jgi:hypothetical protein
MGAAFILSINIQCTDAYRTVIQNVQNHLLFVIVP